jgi:hypothetical protein
VGGRTDHWPLFINSFLIPSLLLSSMQDLCIRVSNMSLQSSMTACVSDPLCPQAASGSSNPRLMIVTPKIDYRRLSRRSLPPSDLCRLCVYVCSVLGRCYALHSKAHGTLAIERVGVNPREPQRVLILHHQSQYFVDRHTSRRIDGGKVIISSFIDFVCNIRVFCNTIFSLWWKKRSV